MTFQIELVCKSKSYTCQNTNHLLNVAHISHLFLIKTVIRVPLLMVRLIEIIKNNQIDLILRDI